MKKPDDSTPAIRRRVPGLMTDLSPAPGAFPNPRDADPPRRMPSLPMGMQVVGDFGGDHEGFPRGRDVGARANRCAPTTPGRAVADKPPTPVIDGIRSPS